LLKGVEQLSHADKVTLGPKGRNVVLDKKFGSPSITKDGVITVEEGKALVTEMKIVEGMQFDQGYLSPYFATDMQTMECELDDPYILIQEKKISSIKDILPLLEKVAKSGDPLLIIAEDVEGEALATEVVNKIRGIFKCAAVKPPDMGIAERRCWKAR